MTEDARLPDADWCDAIGARLAGDAAYRAAMEEIGSPLFVKLKAPDGDAAVILRLAAPSDPQGPLRIHAEPHVSEEGTIVSTDTETWGRLLRGATDLTTAVMGRDVKATGSMFRLMRIATPAERVLERISAAMRETKGASA